MKSRSIKRVGLAVGFAAGLVLASGSAFSQIQIQTQGDGPVKEVPSVGGVAIEELPQLAVPNEANPPRDETGLQRPVAVFRGLDKVTARVQEFDAKVDEIARFGSFDVTVRRCNKRPPEETPFTTAFVEVREHSLDGTEKPVFEGWMFASSPGLNAVEHPVYDVWLIDCKAEDPEKSAAKQ